MKWYNENKTLCVNLDLVPFWVYNKSSGELRLILSGGPGGELNFSGEEAKEIYNMLTTQKQLI